MVNTILKTLFIALAALLISCESSERADEACECTIIGRVYQSTDYGATWHYLRLAELTGEVMPCYYAGTETNQEYGDTGIWKKTVWECE
jgi:hypothetical protein